MDASAVSAATAHVCKDIKLNFTLKKEQEDAIKHILAGSNLFCMLPTGFGKSEIFGLVPLIMNKVLTVPYHHYV